MTELEKAIAIIAAASSVAETVVSERLKSDDAPEVVATEYFEPKYKEQRDQGHKTATMKERKGWEKAFKDAGIEGIQADDPSAALVAAQAHAKANAGTALTDEQVLNHPAAVKALNTLKQSQQAAVDAARQEERQALADREKAFTKSQVDATVRKEAERVVTELNPNFSTDPARAAKQRERLIDDLIAQGGYQIGEGGAIQLVDEHGNLLDGKLGKPAQFTDRVRDYADSFYGLPVAQPREIPPAGQPSPAADGIKTKEDFDAAVVKAQSNPEALEKLLADYPDFTK